MLTGKDAFRRILTYLIKVTISYLSEPFLFFIGLFVVFASLIVSCSEEEKGPAVCTVIVKSAGNGSVAINRYIGTSTHVLIGNIVEVIATPDDGYDFSGWCTDKSETPISIDALFKFVAVEDIALTARFVEHPVDVQAVDLGLPSGLKWANCNVGAAEPWEYGGYYAWGEIEERLLLENK